MLGMEREFEGRIVCIPGGSGALGRAVVAAFAAAGARCFIPSRREPAAGDGPSVRTVGGIDLADESSVCAFYAQVAQEGPLWASVQLAGAFAAAPVLETTAAQFVEQFEANALSGFLCCREAIRHMRASGAGGRIVNVTARPALEPRGGAGMAAYTASKAAVAALSQALAEETARDGIWINAVAPSIIDTPANRAAQPGADYGRWPKPEELAATIAFLASPMNRCSRGSLVSVAGGC